MTPLSQRSPEFKSNQLGTCSDTYGSSGCKLFSLCILYDLDPNETNDLFKRTGVYQNGCLIADAKAAEVLGVTYEGSTKEYQNSVCIAETDHFKANGVPQHFFVWLGTGEILDPLDGQYKTNKYNIVSFRLFREKETMPCFADRNMVIAKTKEMLDYWYDQMYAGQGGVVKPDTQKLAEQIADDNVNLKGFVQNQIKTDFFKVFMRKVDCKSCPPATVCPPCPDCPPNDCTTEVKTEQERIRKVLGI